MQLPPFLNKLDECHFYHWVAFSAKPCISACMRPSERASKGINGKHPSCVPEQPSLERLTGDSSQAQGGVACRGIESQGDLPVNSGGLMAQHQKSSDRGPTKESQSSIPKGKRDRCPSHCPSGQMLVYCPLLYPQDTHACMHVCCSPPSYL